jgi:uncharacterized protein with HEPN domain
MQRNALAYLYSITESCSAIEEKLKGVSLEEYEASWELQAIVERKLITIGEAMAQIREVEPQIFDSITDAPLIVGIRNRIVHGYLVISHATVYDAAQTHVPILHDAARALL